MTVTKMPAAIPPTVPNRSGRRQALLALLSTTPGSIRLALVSLCLLCLLFWFVADATTMQFRHVVSIIGVDSFPSIEAAGQIRAGLADMDANAANGFFSSAAGAGHAQYEQDRRNVASAVVKAARNISYKNQETIPVTDIIDGLLVYTGQVETARTLGYPKGLTALCTASDFMRSQLIPASDTLNTLNYNSLSAEYKGHATSVGLYAIIFKMTGLLLLGVLIGTQIFLCARTRRIFNIPLAAATVILLGFILYVNGAYTDTELHLKSAKEDSFDTFYALWKAKADAFEANADESFYLLEKPTQARYEQEFRRKASLLADRPLTPQIVAAAQQASQSHEKVIFKGFFADILNNISYEQEQAEAMDVLKKYAKYMEIDTEIRRLETTGNHQDALTLCTGTNPGQMNGAFDAFNTSLDKIISLKKTKFNNSIASAFTALDSLPPLALLTSLCIAALCWYGLSLRLREYAD